MMHDKLSTPLQDPARRLPLAELWRLRDSDQVPQASRLYQDTCYSLGLRLGESAKAQLDHLLSRNVPANDALDFLLMEVSFLRHRLDLQRAWERLREIEQQYLNHGVSFGFTLYNQKAINYFAQSNFTLALEGFSLAAGFCSTPLQKHINLLNQIICMEYLGYDYQIFLHELLCEIDLDDETYAQFRDHIMQLRLREAWRNGDCVSIRNLPKQYPTHVGNKSAIYLAWLDTIPTLDLNLDDEQKTVLQRILSQSQIAYMIGYRQRTLQGLLIKEDLSTAIRPVFKIERFYLWTWRWLLDPDSAKLQRLIQLRRDLSRCLTEHLSPDNFRLYRISLRWLALFTDVSDQTIDESLTHLVYSFESSQLPQLNQEEQVLDLLRATIEGNRTLAEDTRSYLRSQLNGLDQKPPLLMLVDAFEENTLPLHLAKFSKLKDSIQQLKHLLYARTETLSDGVLVDLSTRTINLFKNGVLSATSTNDGILKLLTLASGRPIISCMEMILRCFGHHTYDPTLHDSRIANLLNKANNLLNPYIVFRRKNGYVHVETQNDAFKLYGLTPHSESILLIPDLVEALIDHDDSATRRVARENKMASTAVIEERPTSNAGRWLCRQDFEAELGVSRATALRKLQKWIDDRLVTKRGQGRSSRYLISPALLLELRQAQKGAKI